MTHRAPEHRNDGARFGLHSAIITARPFLPLVRSGGQFEARGIATGCRQSIFFDAPVNLIASNIQKIHLLSAQLGTGKLARDAR
jgi:hypothetical protein